MSESKRKDVIEDDTKKYFKDSNEINKKLKTENSTRDQSNKVNKIQLSLSSSISTKSKLDSVTGTKKPSIDIQVNKTIIGNLASNKKETPAPIKSSVASVFKDDSDDDEPEEMPFEAKMKMRNLGKNTPTSQGPNSYGKTKLGFCDTKMLFEKQLKEKAEELLRQEEEKLKKGSKKGL